MSCFNSESSKVEVSPTVLSSDLFTPAIPKKVTFSSVGVFRRPNKVTSWGSESTKYGGIGKLPLLTQTPNTVNYDVVKSRSHRHYSSGVNNFNACSQPYAVTSLSLSGCRINDQLLPAPYTEHGKLEEPWPGHAYTSHICQFEVFPRFDPERTKFDVSCVRKLKQKLNPATEEALEQLSRKIYRTTVYQDNMKEFPKHSPTVHTEEGLVRIKRGDTGVIGLENWEIRQEEVEENQSSEDEDETEESQDDGEHKSEKELENKKISHDSELPAVWPIWPVGINNMRKMPLNYPKIPLPTYNPLDFSKRDRLQKNTTNSHLVSEEQTIQRLESGTASTKRNVENRVRFTNKYIPALTSYNYSTLGLRDARHLKFTIPETKDLKEMRRFRVGPVPVKHLACVDFVRLPLIGQDKTAEQSHEQPRKKNHCATRMLGVRFKTDAHKRYHQMYSNIVPDLRDSTITGRQHFFWGVHASALR